MVICTNVHKKNTGALPGKRFGKISTDTIVIIFSSAGIF